MVGVRAHHDALDERRAGEAVLPVRVRVHVHVVRPDAESRRAPYGDALQRVASLRGRGDPDEVRVRHVALAPVPLPGEANAGRCGGRVADGLLPGLGLGLGLGLGFGLGLGLDLGLGLPVVSCQLIVPAYGAIGAPP